LRLRAPQLDGTSSNYKFEQYETEFHKKYSNDEERSSRRALFEQKLAAINVHNQGNKSWKEGVNKFTDRTDEELNQLLGLNKNLLYASKYAREQNIVHSEEKIDLSSLPKHVDWREKGVVSNVKDQGSCGSCWTFGTTETVESYWALATGDLQDLSEQQILDCTPNTDDCGGTGGCGGGTPEIAYKKIQELGGQTSEWEYPYISYFGEAGTACLLTNSTQKRTPYAVLSNFTVLPSNQYEPVMRHLAEVGPLAVNVDASSWFSYESGVYNGCNMTSPDIDHVVQLVGYGTDAQDGDFWLVRNSWNPTFGEQGYIRLRRIASSSDCGIDTSPADGTGCNNGPSEVLVCGECGILYDTSYPTVSPPSA